MTEIKARTFVESTCDRINDPDSLPIWTRKGSFEGDRGRLIALAQVTTINGGIDQALWITLNNGYQCMAFVSEISFE